MKDVCCDVPVAFGSRGEAQTGTRPLQRPAARARMVYYIAVLILLANSPAGVRGPQAPEKILFCGWCGRQSRPHEKQNKSFLEGKALQTSHLSKPAVSVLCDL